MGHEHNAKSVFFDTQVIKRKRKNKDSNFLEQNSIKYIWMIVFFLDLLSFNLDNIFLETSSVLCFKKLGQLKTFPKLWISLLVI